MVAKPFKTIEEQIEILKARGMSFTTDVKRAKEYLEDYTYYGVINGYSDLFWNTDEHTEYKTGTSFSELKALHHFDESLRRFFTPYILQVESIVKSHIVYEFCAAKKNDGTYCRRSMDYLKQSSFDPDRNDEADKLIPKLREILHEGKRFNGPIKHYVDRYGFVPIWVLATQMSFGNVVSFFTAMMPSERNAVAKRFSIREHELGSLLKVLRDFRNTIAHSNRVYCFKTVHRIPRISQPNREVGPIENWANTRFGSVLYILNLLLSPSDFKHVCNELSTLLIGLSNKLKTISVRDVARSMGLPQSMRARYKIRLMQGE